MRGRSVMNAFFAAPLTLSVELIPLPRLALALLPVIVVFAIFVRQRISLRTYAWAMLRMVTQLLLLGFILVVVFESNTPVVVLAVLAVMLVAASWISLRVSSGDRRRLLPRVLLSVAVGGGLTLIVVTQFVLQLEPWYEPKLMIPFAGMIFSGCMNAVSLALERFEAETSQGVPDESARRRSFEAALIPITNSLFAVGLVSIPGFMTGQVSTGEDPHNAARYQIMVMCMMFGSAGISASLFLALASRHHHVVENSESL